MGIELSQVAVDLIINIINIILLFVIVRSLVYKPVKKFLDARREKIDAQAAKAEELKKQYAGAEALKEQIIADANEKGDEVVRVAAVKAKSQADKIIADANEKAEKITADAELKASAEKERVLASAKDDIVDMAITLSGKILERELNADDARRAAQEFFEAIE